MYCSNCGKEMPDGSAFCPSCGFQVGQTTSRPTDQGVKRVAHAVGGFVNQAADALNEMTGGSGHVELKFRNLFDSVFKKHSRDEAEELFACGTPSTTPCARRRLKGMASSVALFARLSCPAHNVYRTVLHVLFHRE